MKGSFRNSCNVLRFRVAGRRVKRFPFFTNELDLLAQGPEVQSQWVSEKLTCTVALQRAQSAQETMICSLKWSLVFVVVLDYNDYTVTTMIETDFKNDLVN